MRSSFTGWQLPWTPMAINASRSWRSPDKIPSLTFKLNLFLVRNLPDVRSIVIHSHVTHQENPSMIQDSRKRAVDCKQKKTLKECISVTFSLVFKMYQGIRCPVSFQFPLRNHCFRQMDSRFQTRDSKKYKRIKRRMRSEMKRISNSVCVYRSHESFHHPLDPLKVKEVRREEVNRKRLLLQFERNRYRETCFILFSFLFCLWKNSREKLNSISIPFLSIPSLLWYSLRK